MPKKKRAALGVRRLQTNEAQTRGAMAAVRLRVTANSMVDSAIFDFQHLVTCAAVKYNRLAALLIT